MNTHRGRQLTTGFLSILDFSSTCRFYFFNPDMNRSQTGHRALQLDSNSVGAAASVNDPVAWTWRKRAHPCPPAHINPSRYILNPTIYIRCPLLEPISPLRAPPYAKDRHDTDFGFFQKILPNSTRTSSLEV